MVLIDHYIKLLAAITPVYLSQHFLPANFTFLL